MESAEESREAFGARLAFDDYRKMIEHPEIDAVAVSLRVPNHYDPTMAAINAGKHVLYRVAPGPHHRRGRRDGRPGPGERRPQHRRFASPRQPGDALPQGPGGLRLRRRGDVLPRSPHFQWIPGTPVGPHLATGPRAWSQHPHHPLWAYYRRAADGSRRLQPRFHRRQHPGEPVVRDRHGTDGGRHLARQHPGQRTPE